MKKNLHKNCALAKFLHNSCASLFFLCKSCRFLLFYFILFYYKWANRFRVNVVSIRALDLELIPVSWQSDRRWRSHKPGSRLPLLSARSAVTFPAEEQNCLLVDTKLYCLVTEAHRCKQLAQGHCALVPSQDLNPRPVNRKSDVLPIAPSRDQALRYY